MPTARCLKSPGWYARKCWKARQAGIEHTYRYDVRGQDVPPSLPRLPVTAWTREPLPAPKRPPKTRTSATDDIARCDVCNVAVPNGRLGNLYVRCATHATVTHAAVTREEDRPRVWDMRVKMWR